MRKNVIAIQCSRCATIEYKEGSVQPDEATTSALVITMGGKQVCTHPDLCENCLEVVTKLVATINKELEKKSPTRKKKEPETFEGLGAATLNGGPKPPAHPPAPTPHVATKAPRG